MKDDVSKFNSLEEYRASIALSDKDLNYLDELTLQDKDAAKNTFYHYPRVEPDIIKANPNKERFRPEVRTLDGKIVLDKIDEVTLYILCEFKFIPIWLIQQWYDIYDLNGYDRVLGWIQFGLAWCDATSLGVYIRPTMFLLNVIYDKDDGSKKYIGLPFNLMNHTCAEEQLMFDIMMGNPKSEFWNMFNKEVKNRLPCYHPLFTDNIDPFDKTGSTILAESLFRSSTYDQSDLIAGHKEIELEMQTKATITKEFGEWPLFTLECGYNEKGKLETQRPDLVIPVPRIQGMPQSFAIEMELTAKDTTRYDKIMDHYKNNNIYGSVVYLCANTYIRDLVVKSYKNIGGLGTCRLLCIPYTAPAQMLSTFSKEDLEAQYGLMKATTEKTYEVKKNDQK